MYEQNLEKALEQKRKELIDNDIIIRGLDQQTTDDLQTLFKNNVKTTDQLLDIKLLVHAPKIIIESCDDLMDIIILNSTGDVHILYPFQYISIEIIQDLIQFHYEALY